MNKTFFELGVGILLIIALGLLLALPLMYIWNGCLVPAVEGVHEVGWVQMWGLVILIGTLFKSTSNKD